MDRGWIKLYRKIVESRVFHNSDLLKVWIWCMAKATHKEIHVPIKTGRGITDVKLVPGQFVFGRDQAARELNMKSSSVRNRMEKLKKIGNVDMQPDSHYTVVTICNWEQYQAVENEIGQASGQREDNQRTTKGQPKDTYKNIKNKENKEKDTTSPASPSGSPDPALEIFDSPSNQNIFSAIKDCSYYHLLGNRTVLNARMVNSLIGYESGSVRLSVIDEIIKADAHVSKQPSRYRWSSNNSQTPQQKEAGARKSIGNWFSNAVRFKEEG